MQALLSATGINAVVPMALAENVAGVCVIGGGGGYGKHQWLGQLEETTGNKKCSAFAKHLILFTY